MTPRSEFSHKVTVEPWPEDGVLVELTATAAEREALRARFDLADLTSLSASAGIERKMTELVLAGTIEATVAQACVVTLKPIISALEVPFERRYRRRETHEKLIASGETSEPEDEIDIELLDGGEIDVGEAIAEELYLALDPYPRAPDADRALQEMADRTGVALDEPATNPFEKLRRH